MQIENNYINMNNEKILDEIKESTSSIMHLLIEKTNVEENEIGYNRIKKIDVNSDKIVEILFFIKKSIIVLICVSFGILVALIF